MLACLLPEVRLKISKSLLFLPLLLGQELAAVTLGQIQPFDDPVSGWVTGVGPMIGTPIDVPLNSTGGRTGDDDPYLNIIATGGTGPGSRLSAQNFDIWSGDYLAAGVNQIRMDVRNFGSTDLALRLLFVEFNAAMEPVSAAFTDAADIVGNSDWQMIAFDISPSALTAIPTPFLPVANPLQTLGNTVELRLFHNPDPFFAVGMNPAVVGNLGVDNITAAFIPEPGTWSLLLGGFLAGVMQLRRRRRA
jgi:hypothetical protein